MVSGPRHAAHPRCAPPSADAGQGRALASDAQEPHPLGALRPAGRSGGAGAGLCGALQSLSRSREPRQPHPRRRLLWTRGGDPARTGADQTTDPRPPPLAASRAGDLTFNPEDRPSVREANPRPQIIRRRTDNEPHVIEAVLNHVSGHKAGVAGIYNRALYAVEERQALDLWSEHVRSLIEGAEAKVVSL